MQHARSSVSSAQRQGTSTPAAEGQCQGQAKGFTYTVGLVDESLEKGREGAAARAAAAERLRLVKARDVAVSAMSQRIWQPHLCFKPRQHHAFGGCEMCSNPLIRNLGIAKKGSGASGDVALCDACFLESYSIGDDPNTLRIMGGGGAAAADAASASTATDPSHPPAHPIPPFDEEAIRQKRSANRFIYNMYDWHVIRDLIGLGRDGIRAPEGPPQTTGNGNNGGKGGGQLTLPDPSVLVGASEGGGRETPIVFMIPSADPNSGGGGEVVDGVAMIPLPPRAAAVYVSTAGAFGASDDGDDDDSGGPASLSSTQKGPIASVVRSVAGAAVQAAARFPSLFPAAVGEEVETDLGDAFVSAADGSSTKRTSHLM